MNSVSPFTGQYLPSAPIIPAPPAQLDVYCSGNPWAPCGPTTLSRLAGGAAGAYAVGAVGKVAGAAFGPQGAAVGLVAGGLIGASAGWNAGFAKTVCVLFGAGVGYVAGNAIAGPAAGLVGCFLGGLVGRELALQS